MVADPYARRVLASAFEHAVQAPFYIARRAAPPVAGQRYLRGRPIAASCRASWALRWVAALCCLAILPPSASAQRIVLRDGRMYSGKIATLGSVVEALRQPKADGAPTGTPVVLCDDNLRRYFLPKRQVAEFLEADPTEVEEKFRLPQRVARGGGEVRSVDAVTHIGPFDEHGRRTFSMSIGRRPVDVIQAITELTPQWCKVEGVNYVWDQRLATSSIPFETLDKILRQAIDPKNVEQRLKIVRFFLQAERYFEAKHELEQILKEFPEVQDQVAQRLQTLTQLGARRVLTEIRARRDAGQHLLAQQLLERFPGEGVGGEILQAVRELGDQYRTERERAEHLLAELQRHVEQLGDEPTIAQLKAAAAEITQGLTPATLERLAPFEQFLSDETMLPAERLALALSGWVSGSRGATPNLALALAQIEARNLVLEYLREPTVLGRNDTLGRLRGVEGVSVESVARLIEFLAPPLPPPAPEADVPGLLRLSVPGLAEEPEVEYLVQLPPEYDPHRIYPTIVTLHGSATTAQQQIDWWAGSYDATKQARLGQATRQGYIVLAPVWAPPAQREYDYSAGVHAAVLAALRDACRRFAIDTDRVFLSGHAMGGDAAWDVGLSHPDLWAGVIPIVAVSDRYCAFYWPNAKYVPFYIVGGELDGDKTLRNARDIDRYLSRSFPVTVAEFLGRGHEHFSDEILRLFDWMQRYRRDFFPREFKTVTMRPWDNYFWWVEVDELPPKTVVAPEAWPPPRNTRALGIEATVNAANNVVVRTGAQRVQVWLSPRLVDFAEKCQVTVNGIRLSGEEPFVTPDLAVLLEDVRTRADRQHPFWARYELSGGGSRRETAAR